MPENTILNNSKLFAPLCAFAGAVLMLLWRKEMQPRKMLVAVASGPLFAWLLTPSVVSWLASLWPWLPRDVSVNGAIGCLIGLLAINIVAVVAHFGDRAEAVDVGELVRAKTGGDRHDA